MSTASSYLSAPGSGVIKSESLASIIVACCGLLEYTRQCLRTIIRNSRAPFDLVFLDSSSLDGTSG